jgi:hypothetical protein
MSEKTCAFNNWHQKIVFLFVFEDLVKTNCYFNYPAPQLTGSHCFCLLTFPMIRVSNFIIVEMMLEPEINTINDNNNCYVKINAMHNILCGIEFNW